MPATETPEAKVLRLVGDVIGHLELSEFQRGLLTAMHRAVPCTWVSLNEVGPGGAESALVEPDIDHRFYSLFAQYGHQNPIFQRWLATRDGRAYRFSDVTTRAELERTKLHATVYGPLGLLHQMAFSLVSDAERILAVVLSRHEDEFPGQAGDFSDAERDLVNAARPFLIQAYRNSLSHSGVARGRPLTTAEALLDFGLTEREAEVVRNVALGESNRGIAEQLGISDRTVQKHLQSAYPKLGVRRRAEAAALLWQLTGARDRGALEDITP